MSKKPQNTYKYYPIIPLFMMALCIIVLFFLEANQVDTTLWHVLKDVLIAVLASYIFVFSLHIHPSLKLNDHLIIRRRESSNNNPVSLSVLVGNPYRFFIGGIYDVKITFIYKMNNGVKSNIGSARTVDRIWINKYFRASIELTPHDEIERAFWNDYLNGTGKDHSIIVLISGMTNKFGSSVRYLKEYPIDSIVIGEDCIGALDKKGKGELDIKTGKLKPEIDETQYNRNKGYWKVFNQLYRFKDPETEKEIKKLIKETINAS